MAQDNPRRSPAQKRAIPGSARPPRDERSVGDLFRELGRETQVLIQQEFKLARVEAKEKASKASQGVGWIAAGGFVAYGGFLALIAAVALILGTFMPAWAGFLIAGILVLATGYALVQTGLTHLKNTDFSFNRTAESLQEDTSWIQQEADEVKRDPANLGADNQTQ